MRDEIQCPGCQRRLNLPDDALGRLVQCPSCQRTFVAEAPAAQQPLAVAPPPASPTPSGASTPQPPPTRRYDDSDYDPPRRRGRRDARRDERGRRPSPHRGGEILTFGLLALLPCCVTSIIFGLIAWMMANSDLHEMRTGRMDRDGEGLTQAGRALGITGLFLWAGISALFLMGALTNGF